MVVFTCNNCGDSIQKPKVEKHIQMECKKKFMNASLCCIDCLKDFNRTSYNEHIKCVTELERYSAKGFVAKPASNKGERKQQSWLEVIQSVLKKPSLSKLQRNLLEALSGVSNVPRKKPKFINFIEKSLRHLRIPCGVIDEVFELIESEFKSIQAANNANQELQKKDSKKSEPQTKPEVQNSDQTQSENESKKKNKKNKTLECENNEAAAESQNDKTAVLDQSGAFEVVKKKKKKKKKEHTNNENQPIDNEKKQNAGNLNVNGKRPLENSFEDISAKDVSKKKQKKLKFPDLENSANDSSVVAENQNSSTIEPQLNGIDNDVEKLSKKEKKKKSKSQLETEPESNIASETPVPENVKNENENSEKLSKKEKKKKSKQENQEIENTTNKPALNGTAEVNSEIPNNVNMNFENLSKKERKELKKKLKYEAQLKAIESEAKQPENGVVNNQENDTTGQKPEKKKKRKLIESNENEEIVSKKSKVSETEVISEEPEAVKGSKFSWEDVIKTVLEKAESNEISVKKLSKKVVDEYMWYHPNQKSYEDVVKKFNKKIVKLPFVKVLKDKAKLCA